MENTLECRMILLLSCQSYDLILLRSSPGELGGCSGKKTSSRVFPWKVLHSHACPLYSSSSNFEKLLFKYFFQIWPQGQCHSKIYQLCQLRSTVRFQIGNWPYKLSSLMGTWEQLNGNFVLWNDPNNVCTCE
jgi:hypothetical protein